MYATCLFCNASLGANECIEHFPVGRRLAYDSATGRLWVVCTSCARWNLSPIETRWEAIEEAERLFRATKLRASSDNIGLARLKEGTDLVRIGKPLPSEFAHWRYGDQFGKRRRQMWRTAGGSLALTFGAGALIGSQFLGYELSAFGISAMGLGTGLNLFSSVKTGIDGWKKTNKSALAVRDADGALLRLTELDAREVTLIPMGSAMDWKLKVPRNRVAAAGPVARALGVPDKLSWADDRAHLSGDVAQRALATILPHLNSSGATERGIKAALDVIDAAPDVQHLLHTAATSQAGYKKQYHMDGGESTLGQLPPSLLLALEMSVHSDDERRAIDGELKELEQRWRDADAIAKIADDMFT